MKRVATYIRVSTTMQVQEGESIPAQRDALNKYIKEHGYIHVGEYLDDGISGTKNDRDEFQRMLTDVKAGKIDLIIVTKLDRLHRSLRNFLNMQDVLDKHNCNWLAIWEPMYDSSTPQGRMIINTMVNLAQFEAEQTGQRIRQVFEYKKMNGEAVTGHMPLGYKIENKKVVVDESTVDAVRGAFRHYSEVGSLQKTADFLVSEYGISRSRQNVKRILKNTMYIGRHGKYEHYCQPIIDTELFLDVQDKLSKNIKLSAKRPYIFTGIIKCAECGTRYSAFTRNYHTPAYRCPKRNNYHKCNNAATINEVDMEKVLLENVAREFKDFAIERRAEQQRHVDNSKKIADLNKKVMRLKDLYVNGLIELDEYKADRGKYTEQIAELEKEQARQPVPDNIDKLSNAIMSISEIYAKLSTNEEKRGFWRSIIKEIWFDSEKNIKIIFY